jgi:hypothetical protein
MTAGPSGLPVETFPISQLADQVNTQINGKLRKKPMDLAKDCPISEFNQYECNEVAKEDGSGRLIKMVRCVPMTRFFRK